MTKYNINLCKLFSEIASPVIVNRPGIFYCLRSCVEWPLHLIFTANKLFRVVYCLKRVPTTSLLVPRLRSFSVTSLLVVPDARALTTFIVDALVLLTRSTVGPSNEPLLSQLYRVTPTQGCALVLTEQLCTSVYWLPYLHQRLLKHRLIILKDALLAIWTKIYAQCLGRYLGSDRVHFISLLLWHLVEIL